MYNDIEIIPGGVTAAPGFMASGVFCGIRKNRTKRDLALIVAEQPCNAAAVYTLNKVKAAPLLLTMDNLHNGRAQAILVNSGNANACAPGGMEAAKATVAAVADAAKLSPDDFIVSSTGTIGVPLPVDTIVAGVPALVEGLSHDDATAAEAIMTTDTFTKSLAVRFTLGGKTVTLGGIAKGSGMIHPNMATMMAFITTDCSIEPAMLEEALRESSARTYNRISVDGDMSTNDMAAILASGTAGNPHISDKGEDYGKFLHALDIVNLKLAKDIAKDGEGATKLITAHVTGAMTVEDASKIAMAVIASSLVKSAMFGSDANWGRILAAMGYSGAEFEPTGVDVGFTSSAGTVDVCKDGAGMPFDEALAKQILSQSEVVIEIRLHEGDHEAQAYGCDLTYDYVKINGDYRS
ncbi:MAG: bifunctional glutamate N-acetyltransferase/amino-acid acetyltransferase ArgJ [Defluviitaleaceae bacterium]|nr:bifunctional glutamate N-acetyltransferase/amino-acid acetyltransferase ArgJ [Defluviitaleaceae bacterium]